MNFRWYFNGLETLIFDSNGRTLEQLAELGKKNRRKGKK